MCGIGGFVDLAYNDSIINDMLHSMQRRGPDANGCYIKDSCVLLHTRLAVVDILNGKQPMELQWGQEHFILVYNGELYNTEEIRAELLNLGHCFAGRSDTEVVIHAYAQWGADCLERMNGIFAFAIWHENAEKLFLARDRMGVKPLFYKLHDGAMLFSSEIKTILQYPTVKAEIDLLGILQVLMLGPGRLQGSGVFRGIYELKPGFYGIYQNGKWHQTQYWKLTDAEHTDRFEETCEKVRYLVTDAITRQTVSDVELGTFLSGGLDSSLISAVCAAQMQKKGQRLKTFSLDFENNDKYFVAEKFQPETDNYYIESMCDALGCVNTKTVLSAEELFDALHESVTARDLPGMADVDSSLLCFCGEIKQHVTVALSGECADEIFGGYPWYRDPAVRALSGFPWSQNIIQRSMLVSPGITSPAVAQSFVEDIYHDAMQQCDILPGADPIERRMKQMVNLNQNWFMQTLLDRKDRMSMYHGLEVRVPFCDYRIAEYLYSVPWEFKNYKGIEKGLLRCAIKGILPNEVLWRKKCPYPKTYDPAYCNLVTCALNSLMESSQAPLWELINKNQLKQYLENESQWPWYGQLMRRPQTIAYMLMINKWLEMYGINVIAS